MPTQLCYDSALPALVSWDKPACDMMMCIRQAASLLKTPTSQKDGPACLEQGLQVMIPYTQTPDCTVAGQCPADQGWHLSQLQMRPLAGHCTFMWKSCIKPVLQSTACWGTGGCQRCRLHRGSITLK